MSEPLLDPTSSPQARHKAVIQIPGVQRLDSEGQSSQIPGPYRGSQPKPPKRCCMRGVSSVHPRSKRCTKAAFAVFNVANAAMGVGVLAFPLAFKQAGYLFGTILTCVYGAIMTGTLIIIAKAAREHDAISYQELLGKMFGANTKTFLMYTVSVFVALVNVNFLLVMASQATPVLREWTHSKSALLEECGHSGTSCSLMWLLVAGIYPICIFETIDKLGPFSLLGVGAVFYTAAVIVYHGVENPNTDAAEQPKAVTINLASIQAVNAIAFAMFCHFTVVPASHTLKPYWPSLHRAEKTRVRTLVIVCMCIMGLCVLFYTPVGVLGYFTFGSEVMNTGDILDNYGHERSSDRWRDSSADIKIARLAMAFTTCMSFREC